MPKIKVKLTATNVQTSTSSFYDATRPAGAHPVFSTNGPPQNGSISVNLPVGLYTLMLGVSGVPGPFGPVTVLDANDQVLGTNPIPGEIFPSGTGGTAVRFTVRAPAAMAVMRLGSPRPANKRKSKPKKKRKAKTAVKPKAKPAKRRAAKRQGRGQ
jgi:hypothetical protein